MSELVVLTFPKSAMTLIYGKNGKDYYSIEMPDAVGYDGYTFLWPKDKIRRDRRNKDRRVIFMGDNFMIELRHYVRQGEKYESVASAELPARDVCDLLKQYFTGEEEQDDTDLS